MKKIKVAITGNIGSGKTTFSDYISKKGCAVIIADDISKKFLQNDKSIKQKVVVLFGNGAYEDGSLNNKYIAEKVFLNTKLLRELNSILHPKVISEIDSIIAKDHSNDKYIFIESALVYETNIEKNFDYVVLVTADFNLRIQRATGEGRFDEMDFIKRDENQIPQSEKEKKADFIFTNNGSREELFKKADLLLLTLGLDKI